MRPNFGVDDVLMAVDDLYGFQCEARELPSYSDQNFLITRDDGVKFVFKVANDEEPTEVLQFQQNVLMHLQKSDLSNQCPRVIAMVDGQRLGSMGQPSTHHTHPVWMVSFLDGKFMSKLPEYSPGLLHHLGSFLGTLDRELQSFQHPAMHRDLPWDLKQAGKLLPMIEHIDSAEHRTLVTKFLNRSVDQRGPRWETLRTTVIHNDANDNNILVENTGTAWRIQGIIDFGDMLHSYTIGELAIASAYAILQAVDIEEIVSMLCSLAQGYHRAWPLNSGEIDVLFDLVCLRLCTSVCMSARERKAAPDNAYLAVSEQPAWHALKQLATLYPEQVTETIIKAVS